MSVRRGGKRGGRKGGRREDKRGVRRGGKKSANTRNLREACEEQGTRAYHIEGPDELQAEWFEGVRRIGLTAGASTPDYSIDQVEQRIRELAPE